MQQLAECRVHIISLSTPMANGHVFQLVEEIFRPVETAIDSVFYAGVLFGAGRFAVFLRDVVNAVRTYFLPLGNYNRCDWPRTFGRWAVITCGTSGIGIAFAHEFASRGMNVVLISSCYDDLVTVVSELQTLHNVVAYGIHADFSLGPKVFQEIHDVLHEFEVGILVNNQSVFYEHPQYLALVPHSCLWKLMDVNVIAPTVMTHMLLPQMVERQRGAIINICSTHSTCPPSPLLTAYTATSAYLNNFSQALKYENQHKQIVVQTLLPCEVAPSNKYRSTFFTPTPAKYVQHALSTFGVASHTAGYWPHALQRWCGSFVPHWLWVKAVLYSHTRTRREIKLARERNHEHQFTRRRHYIPLNHERARYNSTESRIPDLSLRRTPSPKRKISTIEPPGSPKAFKKLATSSVPLTSTPLEGGSFPSPGATGAPGGFRFNGSAVRRLSNSSAMLVNEQSGRRSSVVKVSRVLVIPSVARVSHHSSRSRPGSPHPPPHPPIAATPTEDD